MRTIAIPNSGLLFLARHKGNVIPYALTGFLLFLVIIPLARLLLSSFQAGHPAMPEGWTLDNYLTAYSMPLFYQALGTTIVISAIGTLLTLGIAVMFAWLIERTDMPLRNLAWALILIPMAIPGVLFALGWALLLSPKTGVLNIMLRSGFDALGIHFTQGPLNIYSIGGLIFLDGLRGVTTVFLMVVGAFRMMDPTMEEAARVAKANGRRAFFQVTLPSLMPAILSAAIYSFISSMESFEGPLAIGLPGGIFVLSTLIYFTTRLQAPLDYGLGAVFGVVYMVMMLVLLAGYRRIVRYSERYSTITGKGFRPRVVAIGKWRYPALGMFVLYFLVTVGAPFLVLLWASFLPSYRVPSEEALSLVSLKNYIEILSMPKIGQIVWNTLSLMVLSATATMLIAFFVSWVIVRTELSGRGALDAVTFFPHAVPGIVIALALMMAYLSPPLKYLSLYGTVWILAMGFIVSYIAFATRLMNSSIIQVQKELEQAAYVCGATPTRTLLAITLPLIFPAFAAGWIWVAVHVLRGFSIPLMLSSKNNQVFAVFLWEFWDRGMVSMAAALGVMLIVVLIPLTLIMRRFIVSVSAQER
ncbi:MAG TPA: iron ABC transporter permease [Candidatus Limnocylindrales bacterium]|nr:iron ABC transporter permease [Candidatus Limnocylindrales bacterium]